MTIVCTYLTRVYQQRTLFYNEVTLKMYVKQYMQTYIHYFNINGRILPCSVATILLLSHTKLGSSTLRYT